MFPRIISFLAISFSVSFPFFAFAETATVPAANFKGLVTMILTQIFNPLIALIIGLAFVTFLWGVYRYITVASTEGKEGARATIIYGIIGLFVMLSVWGLVEILTKTFDVDFLVPQLQTN